MSWPRAALQLSSLVTGLAIAAAVSTARAQDATSKTTIDMNVSGTITTDYNYRGYTLSDHQPSISTNLQPTYGIFYAGINAASVEMPQLSRIQMTDLSASSRCSAYLPLTWAPNITAILAAKFKSTISNSTLRRPTR